jgi:hypothetical protein
MPERIRKPPGRQEIAETRAQLNEFGRVLAAEHEEREVKTGDHIRRELCEIGILERRSGIRIPAAPEEPRRSAESLNKLCRHRSKAAWSEGEAGGQTCCNSSATSDAMNSI